MAGPYRMAERGAPVLVLLALLPAIPVGAAGQTEGTPRPAFRDRLSVEQVLVPVVVRARGVFVDDLERRDFDLWVDGAPTAIESFERSSSAPVHVLVLQDLSGSMATAERLERSRRSVERLLADRRSGDLYTVATFAADGVRVEARESSDAARVAALASAWRAFGRTGIHDAVAEIPRLVSGAAATRGAALLITDGVDNASRLSPRAARETARRAEVPVHVFALGAGQPPPAEGDEPPADWSSDPLRLLAWVTGGRFHPLPEAAGLDAATRSFMGELRSQYVLGFSTSGAGDPEPHEIRVAVSGRHRRAAFRREYFGTAPAEPTP